MRRRAREVYSTISTYLSTSRIVPFSSCSGAYVCRENIRRIFRISLPRGNRYTSRLVIVFRDASIHGSTHPVRLQKSMGDGLSPRNFSRQEVPTGLGYESNFDSAVLQAVKAVSYPVTAAGHAISSTDRHRAPPVSRRRCV